MKIHELEYLPVRAVWLKSSPEALEDALAVSLYGHWCHIDMGDKIISIPTSSISEIEWERP